jgi:hypothetical protein
MDNLILTLTDLVSERLGDGYSVSVKEVLKNNSTKLTGMTIRENGSNMAPNIYLEEIINDFYIGGLTLDECADEILRTYKKYKPRGYFDSSHFLQFQNAKNNIYFSLINTERNQELLSNIPHVDFHDLSIIFKIHIYSDESGISSITIQKHHINDWHISEQELLSLALENTPRLFPASIVPLAAFLAEAGLNTEGLETPMYIMTNNLKNNGACCILYPQALQHFADNVGENLYILPSSIHETLLIPERFISDISFLSDMVKEVNATEVLEEELLSDNAYRYIRETNQITLI